jgi:hypothetical protein
MYDVNTENIRPAVFFPRSYSYLKICGQNNKDYYSFSTATSYDLNITVISTQKKDIAVFYAGSITPSRGAVNRLGPRCSYFTDGGTYFFLIFFSFSQNFLIFL